MPLGVGIAAELGAFVLLLTVLHGLGSRLWSLPALLLPLTCFTGVGLERKEPGNVEGEIPPEPRPVIFATYVLTAMALDVGVTMLSPCLTWSFSRVGEATRGRGREIRSLYSRASCLLVCLPSSDMSRLIGREGVGAVGSPDNEV